MKSPGDIEKRISKIKKELESWRRKGISPEQVRREELLRFKLSRLEEQKNYIGSKGLMFIG
jgi:hypothetical protein